MYFKQRFASGIFCGAALLSLGTVYADDHDVTEEIVVVGSKTNATRQELSTSVGYFDETRIEEELIFNVEDIFSRTANAYTGTTGFGAYSIRGVNNNGIAGGINNSNALASIVVNQVAMGLNSGDYVKPSLFDAGSVEILRGPQSSIQGPNSLIGAIYINYNKPEFGANDGSVRVEGGAHGALRIQAMQNLALVDDVFALRAVVEKRESEGDTVNTTTGSDDVHREDEETLRLSARWQPLGDERLRFDLTYINNESDSNAFGLVVAPPGGDLFDREQPYNVDDDYPTDFEQLSLEIGWALSDSWQLTSVTGSSDFELQQRFDGDLTAFDFLSVAGLAEEDLFSQEIRLNYEGERVDGLIGFFYSDGDYLGGFSGTGFFPDGMGGVMPFNTRTSYLETIEQQALFGQARWQLSDDWNLTVGLRINREERDTENFADNNGVVSDLSDSASFDQIIPSASLSWDVNDTTTIGFSYAQGFQAGGIAFAVFLGQANAYDEEFTDNYEVFFRHQSADGRLILNANAFLIDWTDQQVTATLPGGFPGFDDQVLNVGESALQGFEVEVEWLATDHLSLFANVGVIDTEFEEFVLNGVDLAGRSFPQSGDVNFSVGAQWKSASGWFASGTYRYSGSTFSEVSAPELTELSSRSLLSGRAGYETERWRVYVWGSNLLDDDYELGLFDGRVFGLPGAYGRIGPPRTVGVGLQFGW